MNNYIRILSLKADETQRVVFVKSREEGGINFIYDPNTGSEQVQVFIHNPLPYREVGTWLFDTFESARSFAAKTFADWEMLSWNLKTKRPCEEGGKECGSGECDTCKSIKADGGNVEDFQKDSHGGSCGSCGGA